MHLDALRKVLLQYHNYILGCNANFIVRAPVVNNVDSSSFNYSVEEPILREFGSYDIKHDYSFGIVQPCVRTRDAAHIFDDATHLSQFTILPLPFSFFASKKTQNEKREHFLSNALCFLKNLGLDISRLYVTYFPGAFFDSIVNSFSHVYIEPDLITRNVCLDAGIDERNLMTGDPFDNFLCTSPFSQKFYAGYRYEIFYKARTGHMFEIATGETLLWLQETVDSRTELLEMPGFGLVIGLGLERFLMAYENKETIAESSIIAPLLAVLQQHHINIPLMEAFSFVDSLRALQIIIFDGVGYSQLNRHQRNHVRVFLRRIAIIMHKYSISKEILSEILELNAEIQFWIENMSLCIEEVVHEIEQYCHRASCIRADVL